MCTVYVFCRTLVLNFYFSSSKYFSSLPDPNKHDPSSVYGVAIVGQKVTGERQAMFIVSLFSLLHFVYVGRK